MCLGWQKVGPAPGMDIPKLHQTKAIRISYTMTIFIAMIYASFPIFSARGSHDPRVQRLRGSGLRDEPVLGLLAVEGAGKLGFGTLCYMVLGFMEEILFTIVPQKNLTTSNDRFGLSRSAMFLFVFIIIHAVGNLHVFLGPDDFNGYGYSYARLCWTGFDFHANIVEEYILLAASDYAARHGGAEAHGGRGTSPSTKRLPRAS